MSGKEKKTFKSWYEDNKQALSEKRRAAYHNSEAIREDAKQRAEATRQRRRAGETVQRILYREHNGKSVPVYTTGYVAGELGCSPTMLLNWEKRGWIPAASFDEYHRLYLRYQVALIKRLYKAVQAGKAKKIAQAIEAVHDDW